MRKILLITLMMIFLSSSAYSLLDSAIVYTPLDIDFTDDSGNAMDGTAYGNTYIHATNLLGGGSAYFDGVNDGVDWTANDFEPSVGAVSVWVKSTINYGMIYSRERMKIGFGAIEGCHSGTQANNGEVMSVLYDGGGWRCTAYASTINDDAWHHIVYSWDGTTNFLYIDNVLRDTVASSNPAFLSGVPRLGLLTGDTEDYTGYIDEFGIWDVNLTAGNVSSLWNGGSGYNPYTSADNPPTITMDVPTNGNHLNDTPDIRFAITIGNENATQPTNCSIYVEAVLRITHNNKFNGSQVDYNYTSLAEGNRTWYSTCTDTAGTTTSANYTLIVDRTAPFITTNTIQTDNSTVFDKRLTNFTITDNLTDLYLYSFIMQINSTGGVNKHTNTSTNLSATSYAFNTPIDISGWSTGNYILYLRSGDDFANLNTNTSTYQFNVKANSDPNITSTTPATQYFNTYVGSNINFITAATDADGEPINYTYYFNNSLNNTGASYTFVVPNVTGEYNITVFATDNNSFNDSYIWTLNISAAPPYMLVDLKSLWDDTALDTFDIYLTNPIAYFNDSGLGTITTNLTTSSNTWHNITFVKPGYFNVTYLVNPSINASVTGYVYQNIINFTCFDIINNSINCTNPYYVDNGTQNITVSAPGYYDLVTEQTLTGLQNTTINLSGFYTTLLNITAVKYGGGAINNFTINTTGISNYYNVSTSTLTGLVQVGLINGTYTILIDAEGYAVDEINITIENISQAYEFTLFTTNSISFTFKDEVTKNLIDFETIHIELISDLFASNYSTSNGTLYVDLLSPTLYSMRYWGTSYNQKFYYFDLQNRSHTNLTLYLSNSTTSENITVTIYDEVNNLLEDAYVKVLRYDIVSNSYLQQEIIKTNFEGIAKFRGYIGTEYYKFIVEYPYGSVKKETSPSYLYSNTLSIQIETGEGIAETFYNRNDVTYSLTFNSNTNNFRYTFTDVNNIISQGCLKIYELSGLEYISYSSTCISGATGTILINVSNATGASYNAKAYVYWGSDEDFLYNLLHSFPEAFEDNKALRLFLVSFLVIAFSFIAIWSLPLALFLAPLPLTITSIINLINFKLEYAIGLQIIGILLAVMIYKRS